MSIGEKKSIVNIKYKYGKYHGKGILYNEDGSVKYEGKFKNGEVA